MILHLKRFVFFIIIVFLSLPAFAQFGSLDQYRAEIGLMGGTSFYIGDANPSKIFNKPGLALGGLVRYNINPRYTLKFSIMHAKVAGDTRDYKNKFPMDAYAVFERSFWDMGLNLEFNFVDYGLPSYTNVNNWFSPYIFAGIGFAASQDDLNALMRLDFNIPFGVGVKFKIAHRFNAGLEWSLHTLFVDDFDVTNSSNKLLDNPYGFTGVSSRKNNDKYSIAKAFVSVDLFRRRHCRR